MRTAEFAPLNRFDGYLPIEDHGLIGDGTTAALVGRDGTISWLCVPRFDSMPLFSGLLDHRRGGEYRLCPEDVIESRQYYLDDCAVLITELRCRTALVTIKDALVLRSGVDLNEDTQAARGELLRSVSVRHGRARLSITIHPYGGAEAEPQRSGFGNPVSDPARPVATVDKHAAATGVRHPSRIEGRGRSASALALEERASPSAIHRTGYPADRHRERLAALDGQD